MFLRSINLCVLISLISCSAQSERKVTNLAKTGSLRTHFHKETLEEEFIKSQYYVLVEDVKYQVEKETYDNMQVGDIITPGTEAKMKVVSSRLDKETTAYFNNYLGYKPKRKPKTH